MKNVPMTRRILNLLLAVLFLLLPCLAFAGEPEPMTTNPAYGAMEFKAGEIIVKFREGISRASIQSLLLAEELEILDELDKLGFMLLSVPEGRELEKIEELKRNPLVEYAEPNHIIQVGNAIATESHHSLRVPDVIPNDPYLPWQWNLPKIEALAAWDITTGSDKVVIAVIDSGADLDHPELKDKIWTNSGETPGNGKDDDGNGYVDDVHGWDFVNWPSESPGEPKDDWGHGTFVAGIAAAETNNGILFAGVSWGAEIMPIKVVNDEGNFAHYHLAGAILYAADNDAKIINLSWSLPNYIDPQPLQAAIDYAHDDKGALIVAMAGDHREPDDPPPDEHRYPAALEHVVSVAATDRDDEHADFSCYNDKVDVAAPGTWMWSLLPEYYGQWQGTDVAAAHVSGLAALIWSVNPHLTNVQVTGIITSTAVDLGDPGWDEYFGWGRIDAAAAVRATPHYLEVETDRPLDFLVCEDGSPPSGEITNPNTGCSTWSATATALWLSISDCEGYTPSSVMVSIDKDNLAGYGLYTDVITVTSTMTSHLNSPQTIPVTAMYARCCRSYLPLLFKNHDSY